MCVCIICNIPQREIRTLSCEEKLVESGPFNLEKRELREYLLLSINTRRQSTRRTEPDSLKWCHSKRLWAQTGPWGYGHKLNICKHSCAVQLMNPRHWLPRVAVKSPLWRSPESTWTWSCAIFYMFQWTIPLPLIKSCTKYFND